MLLLPPKDIEGEEKLFMDQLLVELEVAGLDNLELLEAAVIQIHHRIPQAELRIRIRWVGSRSFF